ncbi:MAG: hypothetical protein MUO72_13655 [Bacteroidales bacterium]|nr:hypothetical protein [Bacteroidales bacterium]
MKTFVILINMVAGVMTIIVLLLFIWGIIILISAKCKLRKYPVKGKKARAIGWSFVVVPVCLVALYAVLFNIFHWGSSGNETAFLVEPIAQSILFIVGTIGVYYWALLKAKELDV